MKPTNQSELVEGIKMFWSTVDQAKCVKYITWQKSFLKSLSYKVMPQAINKAS